MDILDSEDKAFAHSTIWTAWRISSRYHSKIFHIVNQILLFIEIADRISRLM